MKIVFLKFWTVLHNSMWKIIPTFNIPKNWTTQNHGLQIDCP